MKNIHFLPTKIKDKGSQLTKCKLTNTLNFRRFNELIDTYEETLNVFITSDETIKDGDWVIVDYITGFTDLEGNPCTDGNIYLVQATNIVLGNVEHGQELLFSGNGLTHEIRFCKKIVLTTDQELIKDGVRAIPDEFLEWFVKNSNCEFVEVEKECCGQCDERLCEITSLHREETIYNTFYKIIIPEEELPVVGIDWSGFPKSTQEQVGYIEPEKETLEEAAEKWVFETNSNKWSNNDDTAGDNYGSFKEGAKWQAERMYSEEDLVSLLEFNYKKETNQMGTLRKDYSKKLIKEWFEQFKNK